MRPPATIDAERLSEEARATLREVALPLAVGYKVPEIARRLGVRPGVVERRLERLRAELSER